MVVAAFAEKSIAVVVAVQQVVAAHAPEPVETIATELDVVATPGIRLVVAGKAHQGVGSIVATQNVVACVAGAVDRRRTGQLKVFEVRTQGICYGTEHLVDAACSPLDDAVERTIDEVIVVASSARHGVEAEAAVEAIMAKQAEKRVIAAQ